MLILNQPYGPTRRRWNRPIEVCREVVDDDETIRKEYLSAENACMKSGKTNMAVNIHMALEYQKIFTLV
jgi:hypothetical protein